MHMPIKPLPQSKKLTLATLPNARSLFLKNKFIYIYFWLCWVFVAACRLSLVAVSRVYSLLQCAGFSLQWLLLLRSMGSRCAGFRSCGTQAQQLWLAGSRAQAQQLWCTGLVALRHVGSSWIRARTRVPCIGRWILNHCATREAPCSLVFNPSIPLLRTLGKQYRLVYIFQNFTKIETYSTDSIFFFLA